MLKIYLLACAMIVWLSLLPPNMLYGADDQSGLVVSSVIIRPDEMRGFFVKYEAVDIYMLLQNCSDREKTDLLVIMEVDEHIHPIIINPERRIASLGPGETEELFLRVSTSYFSEHIRYLLTIKENDIEYHGRFQFDFLEDYAYDLDLLIADCDNPYMVLRDDEEALADLVDETEEGQEEYQEEDQEEDLIEPDELDVEPEEVAPSLVVEREKQTRSFNANYIFASTSIALAGVGAYFLYASNDMYINQYPFATNDATSIHEQIVTYERIGFISLAASATTFVITGVRMIRRKPPHPYVFIAPVPVQNGIMITASFKL